MDKLKKLKYIEGIDNTILVNFDKALENITNNQILEGLEQLKKIENRLESQLNNGLYVDPELVLGTLHNIALCNQLTNNLEECAAYIEACIYNIKSSISPSQICKSKSEKIRKIKCLCLLYIQLSDTLSRLNNHQDALKNAEKASKCIILAVKLCLNYCTDCKKKQKTSQSFIIPALKKTANEHFIQTHSILQYLYLQMNEKKLKKIPEASCIKSALPIYKETDWIYSVQFKDIFYIKLLTLKELKNTHTIKAELSKDFMLDKIFMAVTSYYLIFRELEFLKQNSKKSKSYLKIAISIAECFFPNDCSLSSCLLSEYELKFKGKRRSKSKCKKDSLRSKSVKVIKSNNPVKIIEKNNKKKKLANVAVIPWLARSERNPIINEAVDKIQNTQSEVVLKKKLPASLEVNEKTEPEPQLSEESSDSCSKDISKRLVIFSSNLYEDYDETEPDKYEYMPLKLYDY